MNTDLSTDSATPRHHRRRRRSPPSSGSPAWRPARRRCSTPPVTPSSSGSAPWSCAVLVAVGRWVARRVRERREDAADLLAGAAWRAEHMPHLAAQIDRRRSARPGGGGLMWAVTGWVIATWLRVTLALTAAVVVCWFALGAALRRLLAHLRWPPCSLRATCRASCCANGPTKPASAAGGGTDEPPAAPAHPPRAGCGDASSRSPPTGGSTTAKRPRSTTSTWSPP